MIEVTGTPLQPLTLGITVTVETNVVLPALVAVNELILPDPDADKPVAVLLFVQSNVVPVTAPVKLIGVVDEPVHKVCVEIDDTTVGTGFTVTVNV